MNSNEESATRIQQELDEWWDCPECGGPTRVCRGKDDPTVRECTECDWSYTFPEQKGDELYQDESIVELQNWGVTDEGDHLKVYKKRRGQMNGDVLMVKVAEVYREVYDDE
jgi:rubredoxin